MTTSVILLSLLGFHWKVATFQWGRSTKGKWTVHYAREVELFKSKTGGGKLGGREAHMAKVVKPVSYEE